MSNLLKNLLLALGLAILLLLGYVLFFQEDEDALLESSNAGVSSQAALETADFLSRLQVLRSLDINGEIFSDPRFNSLVDQRQELIPEPTGRENPFAPLE